ncbi:MAG TPA: hypothetical protein VJS92_17025 [Candidatus Polarisedimenticolaceae bacterium]|nr:hypothetical protein [Candidatus Polarisedimenticolaceae bacterium]
MAERKSFLLRISPELWATLNRWAAEEFRSVNGQIEFLLQRAADERSKSAGRRVPPTRPPPRAGTQSD